MLQLVRREVGRVGDRPESRDERRLDLADRAPAHAVEERVVFYLLDDQSFVL